MATQGRTIHGSAQVGGAAATPVKKPAARRRWLESPPPVECAGHSTRGRDHAASSRSNEDDYQILVPHFFGVADGVGGGGHGEVASRALLNYCSGLGVGTLRHRDVSGVLTAWVRGADRVVAQRLAKIDGRPGAATFVGLWMRGSRGWLVHVGDARAYRLRISGRRARCEALTTDQTYAALGEAAPEGGSPDDPARMVGCGAVGHPPVTPLGLRPGDIALLCTDGFHRHVPPELIEERMDAWLGAGLPLKDMAAALTRCAYATGSQDDITVLLVRRNRRFRHRGTAFALLAVIGYFALGGWIGQAILWFKENG